jgi:hypothetical protein
MEMNERDMYAFLEKMFTSTFFDELIPGIFHNFANPLNGIMGRSKLLQRRLVDFAMKLEKNHPDVHKEISGDCARLINDINAIDNESEKLFGLFRVSAGKFHAMGADRDVEELNVSNLIENEMNFADFYLDFKHNTSKEIRLNKEVPCIPGVTAFFSMAFWTLIRHAMKKIENSNNGAFFIDTNYDDQFLWLRLNYIDRNLFLKWREFSRAGEASLETDSMASDEQKSLCCALLLLKTGNDGVEITHDENTNMLTIKIPHYCKEKKDKNGYAFTASRSNNH